MTVSNLNMFIPRLIGGLLGTAAGVGLVILAFLADQADGELRVVIAAFGMIVAVAALLPLRHTTVHISCDAKSVTFSTLVRRHRYEWNQVHSVIATGRTGGLVTVGVLIFTTHDGRRFTCQVTEAHWAKLRQLTGFARLMA